jgi:hypothetical protein
LSLISGEPCAHFPPEPRYSLNSPDSNRQFGLSQPLSADSSAGLRIAESRKLIVAAEFLGHLAEMPVLRQLGFLDHLK